MAATFGLVLPSSTGGDVPGPEVLWPLIDEADRSVLEYLWVSDHILWWHPMYESLSLLSAVAARTRRIRIGTAVLLLAMRHPVIVAKTLASIDRLSGGRLTVGIGIGGEFAPEWEAVGVARASRARRTDEMIEALLGLWGPGEYGASGRHVAFDSLDLHPKPATRPPIWIGGRSDPALRRAARLGDGWMGIFLTPERYAERAARLRAEAERRGRDPSGIAASLYVWTCIADTTAAARELAAPLLSAFYHLPFEKLERYAVVGSAEDCAGRFREFSDAGVEHFAVAPLSERTSTDALARLPSLL